MLDEDGKKMYRLHLRKMDFVNHGFTEGVHWLSRVDRWHRRSRTFGSLPRKNEALTSTVEGRHRRGLQLDKEHQLLAKRAKKDFGVLLEERRNNKARRSGEHATGTSSSASVSQALKILFEENIGERPSSYSGNSAAKISQGAVESRGYTGRCSGGHQDK